MKKEKKTYSAQEESVLNIIRRKKIKNNKITTTDRQTDRKGKFTQKAACTNRSRVLSKMRYNVKKKL